MDYNYFSQTVRRHDPISNKKIWKPIALYRLNMKELEAESYNGSGNWEPDKNGFVIEAALGIDWVTEYDHITESEAEELKLQLFPETG